MSLENNTEFHKYDFKLLLFLSYIAVMKVNLANNVNGQIRTRFE